jgi:hypothetical protein
MHAQMTLDVLKAVSSHFSSIKKKRKLKKMNEEDEFYQPALFVVLPGGQCYGTAYAQCADDIVDVTRQEDFLAQVGFYGDDVEKDAKDLPQVASHFIACTLAVFATTQLQTRCFVHVCAEEDVPDVESYRSQRKALRKERRHERTQKRLKYDEEEKEPSEEF